MNCSMMRTKILWSISLAAGISLMLSTPSFSKASEEKPFAEAHVVLQLSDADPSKQTLVLNVASNLIKHYGPDKVDVEIVAFGPGLRLLYAENANKGRISGLHEQGVRFAGCMNTLTKHTELLGSEPDLNPHTVKVTAGVVRILELVGEDYTLVKP